MDAVSIFHTVIDPFRPLLVMMAIFVGFKLAWQGPGKSRR